MEPSTDTNRIYALLRKLQKEGLKPEETNELSNEVFNMAGNNVITQFNANMKALRVQGGIHPGTTRRDVLVAYGTFFAGGCVQTVPRSHWEFDPLCRNWHLCVHSLLCPSENRP